MRFIIILFVSVFLLSQLYFYFNATALLVDLRRYVFFCRKIIALNSPYTIVQQLSLRPSASPFLWNYPDEKH